MKLAVKYAWTVLIFAYALFASQLCYAQNPAIEHVGDFGTIDWVGQKVTAKGMGAPPAKYYGKPQARLLAQRAAVTDARRNLLEVIKGVYIDSTTKVKNFILQDDTILASVKGVLKNSPIDNYQIMPDGTVEATVSMPLTGQMGEILIRMAVPTQAKPKVALVSPNLAQTIRLLENRVKALENKLRNLKQIDYGSDQNSSILKKQLDEQESRVNALSARFDEMAERLSVSEALAKKAPPPVKAVKPELQAKYSGLIIDARKTNFHPCLKPEIYSQGKLVYPGEYVNMQKAVRYGFVRYYRKIGRAQQSTRVGSLPYIIKAQGIQQGKRTIEIGEKEYNTLQSFIAMPDNFMSSCNVVIVF